ncbi:hypothetical protein ACM46_11455 [Chryseobacterium angstadtii]|uniref:Peptidase M14 domain-containing protein n=1 Tax=Chryseobacterium angstadtii TaxID=558151 RepID=A0A0J7L6Z7_9FLAO|nr:M14 family metallocarboxypeptidase [Chryseobacterium angstadtii]KMQ64830.1 hypothetical protein ACM46_11455 [Chryseobacterium angstadtii]
MKSIIKYALILVFPGMGLAQVFNPQSKKVTETFFPEFSQEITTPAFQKKKGFTKYKEMMSFLQNLGSKHKNIMKLSFVGESQKGKKIPLVILNKTSTVEDKIKIWIQGGIHGNEPASTEGVLYLIQELLENPEYSQLLDKLEIGIIPMANIDGYEMQERTAANGMDLNRDQTKLTVPESIYLKQAFSDFNAEVALDFHEFHPFRTDYLQMGKAGYTVPYDVMFLYSGNLNVPGSLRELTENTFVKNAEKFLAEHQLSAHDYFTTSKDNGYTVFNLGSINARASATSYALSNCVSSLIEVRGIDIGRTSFKRRIATTFFIAVSYMQSAVQEKEKLRSILKEAQQENKDVIIRSSRKPTQKELDFIDLSTNKIVTEEVNIRNALRSKPILTRPMPTAYLILPSEKKMIEKLKILGVKVVQTQQPEKLEVENYIVTRYKKAAVKFEGTFEQTLSTENHSVTKDFPAGTYIVYTNQKNKGLVFETVEPEADNGFAAYGVLKAALGDELPVYRYMNSKLLSN